MQISIIVVIDIETALKENTLEGNAYLIDNTQAFAPPFFPRHERVTYARGTHTANGAQASEVVLNWIYVGVAGLPTTLPRDFSRRFSQGANKNHLLAAIKSARNPGAIAKLLAEDEHNAPTSNLIRSPQGGVEKVERAIVNVLGEVLQRPDEETAANIPPLVTEIRGPAVEQGVIYPALYGSPDIGLEGWYWSAAVDTAQVGSHAYVMDVVLYSAVKDNGVTVWEPHNFVLTASVDVESILKTNGFTKGLYPGVLPLAPLCAGDVI